MVLWTGHLKVGLSIPSFILKVTPSLEDIYGDTIENTETVIMLPPYLTTRKSLVYLAELMEKKVRVIVMDLPGLGTRRGERLMMSTTVIAIKETIDK